MLETHNTLVCMHVRTHGSSETILKMRSQGLRGVCAKKLIQDDGIEIIQRVTTMDCVRVH